LLVLLLRAYDRQQIILQVYDIYTYGEASLDPKDRRALDITKKTAAVTKNAVRNAEKKITYVEFSTTSQ
jgi:hypothetical protein